MSKTIKLKLFCILTLLFSLSCKQSVESAIDTPTIIEGKSKITGRIITPKDINVDSIFVTFGVPLPISGEYVKYNTLVDGSGKFSIDVDLETDISLIGLNTSLNPYKSLFLKLKSGHVTDVTINYNSDFDVEKVKVAPADISQGDITRALEAMNKMIAYRPDRAPKRMYDKSIDEFLNHAKTSVSERLKILNNDTLISKDIKGVLSKEFRLFMYIGHVLNYEREMNLNYRNTSGDQSKKPDFQKIDRSYFRFLKDFKLNDPQYLFCSEFPTFQLELLQNEILGLPEIGESDIPSWLARVKVILSDLVGFDHGTYYDILAANAYGRQLNEEVRPLSQKQKDNIVKYWKTGEIAKILLRKNQQVVELAKFKSPAKVNDVSTVPDSKVIEAILSKYKGKVVFIDLWATWCAPCLSAMEEFRSSKNELRDKEVAFVYLTNGSSPRKLWEEKIKGIGECFLNCVNSITLNYRHKQWQHKKTLTSSASRKRL